MYVYSWFIVLRESLLTVRLAVSEIKPVQSLTDRQTDRLTDRQTDRNVNYSNSRCACARGLIILTCNVYYTCMNNSTVSFVHCMYMYMYD